MTGEGRGDGRRRKRCWQTKMHAAYNAIFHAEESAMNNMNEYVIYFILLPAVRLIEG